jgi:type II secretory pathway pseudopilin PulG
MKPNAKMIVQSNRGFSIMETMAILTVTAIMGGVAMVSVGRTAKVAQTTKLEQDIAALNSAVRVFEANGGKIANSWKPSQVIEELKTKADAASAAKLAGVRGSVLDSRVVAIDETSEEAASGEPKALWDSVKHRFYLSTSAARGTKRFALVDAGSETSPEERERAVNLALNDRNGWVWSFTDTPSVQRKAPRSPEGQLAPEGSGTVGSAGTPLEPTGPLALNGPVMTGADAFEGVEFPIVFSLDDYNPEGTSILMVSTNGQDWVEYTGPITIDSDRTIYAYSESQDKESWNDSEIMIVHVTGPVTDPADPTVDVNPDSLVGGLENRLISGSSTGVFSHATGDANLATNLTSGRSDSFFRWGTAASSGTQANHAAFTGSLFDGVAVGDRFLLGNFEYHNGTTQYGTNATAVDFEVAISFMGGSVTKTFDYSFGLFSTLNNTGTAAGDADYFRLTDIQSSGAVNIFGNNYTLALAFGQTTSNGFSTIDEFHIFENSTGTGELWGTIISL